MSGGFPKRVLMVGGMYNKCGKGLLRGVSCSWPFSFQSSLTPCLDPPLLTGLYCFDITVFLRGFQPLLFGCTASP